MRAWCQDATGDDGTTFVNASLHWTFTGAGETGTASANRPMAHVGGGVHRVTLRIDTKGPGTLTWYIEASDPMGNKARGRSTSVEIKTN